MGVIAIGSGGPYALAAAQALLRFTKNISPKSCPRVSEHCRGNLYLYQFLYHC